MYQDIISPFYLVGTCSRCTISGGKVDVSWHRFKNCKGKPVAVGRKLVRRDCELLREHEEDILASQRLETSVSRIWARKNIHLEADLIEEIPHLNGQIPKTQIPGSLALAFCESVSPVLSIAPYLNCQAEVIVTLALQKQAVDYVWLYIKRFV